MVAKASHLELHEDGVELAPAVKRRIERRVSSWMKGHTDITGVSVAVKPLDSGRTKHAFQTRVVLYHRPKNIAAIAKGDLLPSTVNTALDAAERQLRSTRDALRERWKRGTNESPAEVPEESDAE